jgi:hypothetical protein
MRVLSAHDEVYLKVVPTLPCTDLVSQHETWFECIYEAGKAELHDSTQKKEKRRQELCIFWVKDAFMGKRYIVHKLGVQNGRHAEPHWYELTKQFAVSLPLYRSFRK